jgi:hypothetical protein
MFSFWAAFSIDGPIASAHVQPRRTEALPDSRVAPPLHDKKGDTWALRPGAGGFGRSHPVEERPFRAA